jgi:ribosomal protein L4
MWAAAAKEQMAVHYWANAGPGKKRSRRPGRARHMMRQKSTRMARRVLLKDDVFYIGIHVLPPELLNASKDP